MSTRTVELKKKHIHKAICARREAGIRTELGYRPEVKLDIERPRLFTESHRQTEGEPEAVRQARALAHFLANRTVFIFEDERIVGNYGNVQPAITCYPELEEREIARGVTEGDIRDMLSEEDKREFVEICRYWEGKSIGDRVKAVIPEDTKDYYYVNGACETLHHRRDKLLLVNFEKALAVGLNTLAQQAEDKLAALKARAPEDMDTRRYIEAQQFLEAMSISLRAAVRFAGRYADLARDMAARETDPRRKRELEEIAAACDRVPGEPPRTFQEAVQAWFFIHLIVNYFETLGQGGGCRLDVVLYPYYKKDIDSGRLTRAQAQELLENLWIKINDGVVASTPEEHASSQGAIRLFHFTIGGVDKDGNDASNELSSLMIDASMALHTLEPLFALRYHPRMSEDLLMKAIDCIRTGVGYPSVFNDSVIIPWLTERDIPLEDARDYGIPVCVEPILPGKAFTTTTSPSMGVLNLAKCFELALYQGKDPLYGAQLGCVTPPPETFQSIDDVMDAYLQQVRYVSGKMAQINRCAEVIIQEYRQRPFASALIDDCIETAQTCMNEFYAHTAMITAVGPVNVIDSLAAINKFVFDEKKFTMTELIDILKNDWGGDEALRQEFINKAPKFGNDDDYVDRFAREVFHRSQEEVAKSKDIHGSSLTLDGSIANGYWLWGRKVGATPDGRRRKETLADGNGSPMAGRDRSGPTAVLNSLGKINQPVWATLVNQRFMPQFLEGANKQVFAQYLKTFSDLGVWHIQFNVIDDKTLFDAQKHPENYDDLIVRVAGFSAYFVDLSKFSQDQIIGRMAQSF
ncbi:MAG: pyruvate formate lyase family protein [Chloroflexota bacterium]